MIHEVHNLRMLCGDIVAVQAIASQAIRGFPVEDTVSINLRFANGALGSFMLSDTAASARSWEQTSQENKAYPTYPDEDCYVVIGTFGSLSVPTMRLKTYPRAEDRSWWKSFEEGVVGMVRDDPLKHQLEHFGAVVRGEAKPLVSARDGLKNLRITEAIATAAKTGADRGTAPPTDPRRGSMKVLMLHGINHNMFGKRDPKQYGTITLAEIDAALKALGKELGAKVTSFQTNSEAAMCERIHQAYVEKMDACCSTPARGRTTATAFVTRWRS